MRGRRFEIHAKDDGRGSIPAYAGEAKELA